MASSHFTMYAAHVARAERPPASSSRHGAAAEQIMSWQHWHGFFIHAGGLHGEPNKRSGAPAAACASRISGSTRCESYAMPASKWSSDQSPEALSRL